MCILGARLEALPSLGTKVTRPYYALPKIMYENLSSPILLPSPNLRSLALIVASSQKVDEESCGCSMNMVV